MGLVQQLAGSAFKDHSAARRTGQTQAAPHAKDLAPCAPPQAEEEAAEKERAKAAEEAALRGLEAHYAATVSRLEMRISQAEAQSRMEVWPDSGCPPGTRVPVT